MTDIELSPTVQFLASYVIVCEKAEELFGTFQALTEM